MPDHTSQALKAIHSTALPAAAPEWVQLLPAGTFGGVDGRGPWTLTDAAAVIAESRRRAGEHDLPVDYGHELDFGEHNGVGAPASGWIQQLEARADGIWGRVEWTDDGAAAIASKQYRYLSPVFFHSKAGEVLWIARAGLTNKPNLALKALSSQESQEIHVPENKILLQRLAAVLGLPETSDGDAVIARCSALAESETEHRARCEAIAAGVKVPKTASAEEVLRAVEAQAGSSVDPAKFVPIAQYQELATSVKALQDGVATEKAEAAVNAATEAGKLLPAMRDWAIQLHTQSPEQFRKFIEAQPVIVQAGESATRGKPNAGEHAIDDDDKAVCTAMGISIEDFRKNLET